MGSSVMICFLRKIYFKQITWFCSQNGLTYQALGKRGIGRHQQIAGITFIPRTGGQINSLGQHHREVQSY